MPSEVPSNDNEHDCAERGQPDIFDLPDVVHAAEVARLQQRCNEILAEMQEFHDYLKLKRLENKIEISRFKAAVQTELRLLNKIAKDDPSSPKTKRSLQCSNLVFYSAVWSVAKTCSGLVSLLRRTSQLVPTDESSRKKSHTVVDIVANNGLEWIKVSSVSEKRIIWDLTKNGWTGSESDEDEDENCPVEEDDSEGILKQAKSLLRASRMTRVNYRYPSVIYWLPRIKANPDSIEVENVLQQIRAHGVTVNTSDQFLPEIPIAEAFSRMVVERPESLTETLNVDCTILLAFVSDISYGTVESQHNRNIIDQMKIEKANQLLPNSLWPISASKKLVCTREAFDIFRNLIATIGTESEKRRAELIFNMEGLPKEEIIPKLQGLSVYEVPSTWNLPIEVVDIDLPMIVSQCPAEGKIVYDSLSPINQSVFLYGWATGLTTLSSNRGVSRQIETIINENRVSEETQGPDIWLSPASRSLVGKEKNRRGN